MKSILRMLFFVILGLAAVGCATSRLAQDDTLYPSDPWYADLEPFSKDRMTDWALFDLSYPTMPNLEEPSSNPFYDLKMLLK
jgi:hypothetical protein